MPTPPTTRAARSRPRPRLDPGAMPAVVGYEHGAVLPRVGASSLGLHDRHVTAGTPRPTAAGACR